MATEKVRIKYEVDKKQLDASNKSLKKTAELNELTQKEVDETNEKFEDQEQQLSKTNKAFAGLGGQLTAIGNRFQIAGKGAGDMAAGLFKTTTATNLTSKAMKVLKFAIASTGIGLLVIALGSLVAFFTKSQKGSDLLSKAMAGIGAVVDVIVGKLAGFGETIVKVFSDPKKAIKDLANLIKENIVNRFVGLIELIPALGKAIGQLFSGDFADAAETAGNAVGKVVLGVEDITGKIKGAVEGMKELTAEIGQAVEDSGKYEALLIRIREAEIKVTADVARRSRIIQDLLLATRDGSLTFLQQQEALDEIEKLQIQNQLQLTDLAVKKLNLAKLDLANTPIELRMDDQRLAIATAQAAVDSQIGNEKARQRDTANRQLELANRILAATKAQEAEEAKIASTREKFLLDSQTSIAEKLALGRAILFEERLIELEEQGATELELKIAQLDEQERLEKEAIENSVLDAKIKARKIAIIEKKFADAKKELTKLTVEEEIAAKKTGLATINGLIMQGLGDSKEAAVFSTAINTQEAAVAAFKAVVGIPVVGPALAPFAAAAAIAFGLNSIAKITSTPSPKFEKGGRIGGNLHSGGGTIIEAERDEFMMSRRATSKYGFEFMDKINNLELNDLTTGGNGASINIIDTNPIADQLKNMPQNIINVDSEGFALHQRRGQHMMSQKIERYST